MMAVAKAEMLEVMLVILTVYDLEVMLVILTVYDLELMLVILTAYELDLMLATLLENWKVARWLKLAIMLVQKLVPTKVI